MHENHTAASCTQHYFRPMWRGEDGSCVCVCVCVCARACVCRYRSQVAEVLRDKTIASDATALEYLAAAAGLQQFKQVR